MGAEARALWEQLFTDFAQFEDHRSSKAAKNGNGPDFIHNVTKKGLW